MMDLYGWCTQSKINKNAKKDFHSKIIERPLEILLLLM